MVFFYNYKQTEYYISFFEPNNYYTFFIAALYFHMLYHMLQHFSR